MLSRVNSDPISTVYPIFAFLGLRCVMTSKLTLPRKYPCVFNTDWATDARNSGFTQLIKTGAFPNDLAIHFPIGPVDSEKAFHTQRP